MIALDSATKEINLLIPTNVDSEVYKPALNLRPFVAHLTCQTMGVLFKRLVEDTDDNESLIATRSHFSELLKEVDIGPVVGSRLQKLAHLVNEYQQPTTSTWILRSKVLETFQRERLAPGLWGLGDQSGRLHGFTDHLGRAVAPTDNGQDAPALSTGRQRGPDSLSRVLAEDRSRVIPEIVCLRSEGR